MYFFVRLFNLIAKILLILLAVFALGFALLQSKWAREKIQESVTSQLKQIGIDAKLSPMEGQLPFAWKIQEATLEFSETETLQFESITARLSILPLFKGRFNIDYIHAKQACYTTEGQHSNIESLDWEALREQGVAIFKKLQIPFAVNLSHIGIDTMTFQDPFSGKTLEIGLSGSLKLRPQPHEFAAGLQLFSPSTKACYLDLSVNGSLPRDRVETSLYLNLDSVNATLNMSGSWHSWQKMLAGEHTPDKNPIQGTLEGSVTLEEKWSIQSAFTIASFHTLQLERCTVKSPLIHLKGKGKVRSDLEKSQLAFAVSIPALSKIVPQFTQGSVHAKGAYTAGAFRLDGEAHDLAIAGLHTTALIVQCQGRASKEHIVTTIDILSQDPSLPLSGRCALDYSANAINIQELTLISQDDSLKGNIDYQNNLFRGNLELKMHDLSRLEPFMGNHLLYGSMALNLEMHHTENIQHALISLEGSYLRQDEVLVDNLFIKAHITDPLGTPQGGLYCLAEKLFTPTLYFDKLLIESESTPNLLSSFHIDMQGRTDIPFTLNARGEWKKDPLITLMTLSQVSGHYGDLPVTLSSPTTFCHDANACSLTPFDLSLGAGYLKGAFSATASSVVAELDARHFPLSLLRPLSSTVVLSGFATAQGFFRMDHTDLQGALNVALETAEWTAVDKQDPLRSKGSLQVHLDKERAQTFLHLQAHSAQFLEWTASLPMECTLYPFSYTINPSLPLSSELTCQAHLEDLFNFINIGTSHFTGLLSSRLFLAGTLNKPSLLGKLEWQEGSYENDFIGIQLHHIQALFEAEQDKIRLLDLTCTDDRSGHCTATGQISLKGYTLDATLDKLHAVNFDMIDSTLSGDVNLSGNFNEMVATGDLTIDKATVNIGENLPYDIPHIPFTYIHKPAGIDSLTLKKRSPFLFHMDLKATADQTVHATGKGLRADLSGNIHLKGTNSHINAAGSLDLVKGEYLFSGKIFKLTEGNILFNDKGSPFAYLNVSGTLTLLDNTITVMLRGPITTPQLSFQSNPQKPTSSILALILFNKDISDINQMEAIQLAGTLISISGGAGPDILDSIRKTIGVDRLNISSQAGSDEIAVQIGKYLTKGVMITLVQSATSSQVMVEVELPKGFIFQAETQDEGEGKFSLKLRKSY